MILRKGVGQDARGRQATGRDAQIDALIAYTKTREEGKRGGQH